MRKINTFLSVSIAGLTAGVALTGMVVTAGAAQADRIVSWQSGERCVSSDIASIRPLDDKTLLVEDNTGHAAVIKLSQACLKDRSADAYFETTVGQSTICHPNDAVLQVSLGNIRMTCNIASVRTLSLDQAANLRGQSRGL